MTLNEIQKDKSFYVKNVRGDETLKRRLLDLGFVPGMLASVALVSPFGDPKAYKINGNIIVLRNVDAEFVEVDS